MTTLEHWTWPESGDGVSRVWRDLNSLGTSLFRCPEVTADALAPADVVERLLGVRPTRVEVASIKPKPEGPIPHSSYPHSTTFARFHIDPDPEYVLPPHVQVMICKRQAGQGGESRILDVWPVLAAIEAKDPDLFRQLFETPRRISFSSGDAFGPTIAYRQGNLVCFHGAPAPSDAVGVAFRNWIAAREPIEFRAEAGDVYINNNHRTLHGRRGFTDPSREFLRILAWLPEPLAAPAPFLERAQAVSRTLALRMSHEPPWVRQAFGLEPPAAAPVSPATGAGPRWRRREAWLRAVTPGTPFEQLQAHLQGVVDRLGTPGDAAFELAGGA